MLLTALLLSLGTAQAAIDPACQDLANGAVPEDYREADQEAYLLNYFSLATTLSPLHGPVPHAPGHGSISLEASVIPPLPCERRLVLSYTKTEDTNKAPVMPRPRLLFSFPKIGKVVPYAGFAYVPPLTIFGTRNVIISGEAGVGVPTEGKWSFGARFHGTLMKTVAEIATPFDDADEAKDDLYIGSTFGLDLMAGVQVAKGWQPYAALGFTDVSTFFYIGDDDYVGNNTTPYAGLTSSLGVDVKVVQHLSLAAEVYAAPYNFTRDHLDTGEENLTNASLVTGRLRVGYRW